MFFAKWTNIINEGLTSIFRSPCPLCSRSAVQVFCQDCTQRLQAYRRNPPFVQVLDGVPLYGWGHYEGALKQSLAKLKYDRCPSVAKPLGQWLAQLWLSQSHLEGQWLVVPIPLHRDREQERGYNQADLIARCFCQVTGLPLRSHGLLRTQSTTAQYGLSRLERYQNLCNAFTLGHDLQRGSPKSKIILIDDIYTTGATLKAAIDCFQGSGFTVGALLTVAVSERLAL